MTTQELWMILPIVIIGLSVLVTTITEITYNNINRTISISLLFILISFIASLNVWFGWTFTPSLELLFGNSISVDKFALFFYFLILLVTFFTLLISRSYLVEMKKDSGELIILLLLSISGMLVLVSARELITIYVALELSSLPLIALGAIRRGKFSAEVGIKFFILSSVATAVLLYGFVFLYGFTGTTHLDRIFYELVNIQNVEPALIFSIVAIIAGFGFKMAIVPWQSWIPDYYQGAPIPVVALLSVASKAAAFAIVIRIFYIAMQNSLFVEFWMNIFAIVSILSMSLGNLVALRQKSFLRLLGYSTIAQAGYMLIGLASFHSGNLGLNALLYYIAGYAFSNLTVFFVFMIINTKYKDDHLDNLKGLFFKSPLLSIFMIIGLLSLLGMPPTVGFMGKLFVFSAAIDSDLLWLAIVGGANTVIASFYYLRIIKKILFDQSENQTSYSVSKVNNIIYIFGSFGIIFLGIFPVLLFNLTKTAVKFLN